MVNFSLLVLTVFATPSVSHATYITMETSVATELQEDTLRVHVTVTNKGDEPAYNVKMTAEMNGNIKSGLLRESLKPNDPYTEELTAPIEYKKPGRYPVIVTVDYTDQNQYPFTALSVVYVNYQEAVVGRVVGLVETTPVSDRGKVRVKVRNLEQSDEKISVRLVVPKELTVSSPKREVSLKPGMEETVVFEISNLSALPGSSYQIYALLTYEHDRYHYSNAIGGNIKVEEKKSVFNEYRNLLIAVAVVLALVVAYFNIRRRPR